MQRREAINETGRGPERPAGRAAGACVTQSARGLAGETIESEVGAPGVQPDKGYAANGRCEAQDTRDETRGAASDSQTLRRLLPVIAFQLKRRRELLARLAEIGREKAEIEAEASDIKLELYG